MTYTFTKGLRERIGWKLCMLIAEFEGKGLGMVFNPLDIEIVRELKKWPLYYSGITTNSFL